ncbi:putative zinc finger phd-type protein [Diplodia seriata]|uniref:Putative zinc finger phd-type protein n=1 Tax=Diplodia seriata TaxID=420778 RepID=A0A0G2F1M9_9PEZI|nr:putative zinc finger phd-type protein [Diplodia seriata]
MDPTPAGPTGSKKRRLVDSKVRKKGGSGGTKPGSKKRKVEDDQDGIVDGEDTEEDGASGPRGGTVSARDLKALTLSARDVNHFKDLGNSMLSPPATASPSSPTFAQEAPLSGPDAARVAEIEKEIQDLTKRLKLLKDRERLVSMVRDQVNAVAEREGVKPKDICGYDSRLNWSEGEFALWRATPKGKACFRQGTLDAEPEDQDKEDVEMRDAAEDGATLVNGTGVKNGTGVEDTKNNQKLISELLAPSDVCLKKRCQRHTQWVKIAQYDVSFESSVAKNTLQDLMADEREIRHRALVGLRKERKAQSGDDAMEGEDGVKEGWVEVLG